MTDFGGFKQRAARKPPHVAVLPPTAFADTWTGRPAEDVAVGIRVPSDHDMSLARANAARLAWELHPLEADLDARTDAYNDALLREICALAMCDANDVASPYFRTPEDDVRTKLSTEGVKRLFDELDLAVVSTSPVHREASPEETTRLVDRLLEEDAFAFLAPERAARVRRLLAFVLDELEAA